MKGTNASRVADKTARRPMPAPRRTRAERPVRLEREAASLDKGHLRPMPTPAAKSASSVKVAPRHDRSAHKKSRPFVALDAERSRLSPAKPAVKKRAGAETSDATMSRAPFVLLILALITAGLVGLVLLNTAINENAFRLHKLQQSQQRLDLSEQQLQRDVAELQSSGALDAAAKRLGLVPAGRPGIPGAAEWERHWYAKARWGTGE